MKVFIVFNTVKKAQHYIKHFNKKMAHEIDTNPYYGGDYHHDYLYIEGDRVLRSSGWRCGCGCDRGSNNLAVVGRIKSIV